MKKFYLTTPIYYVNSEPHIGSAYTTIIGDIIARYKRLIGYDVFYLTGTDEHGQKIMQAAKKREIEPKQLCDELSEKFSQLWKDLKITNDYFIRTTDPKHMKTVQLFVSKMLENGDIYKGIYKGWYCIPCETYWNEDETEQIEGKHICPTCGRELNFVEEENYFFRLSKYTEPLLKHFKENPDFVEPDFRRNEMLKILESGLKDLSITRTTFDWGIPMPNDPNHVIYVWVDALINYISAIGYGSDQEKFEKWWPADLHLIGKEINRFHSLIWPAMLMSVGLPLPKKIFAHGWLTVNGQKISKSLGNAIDPREFVKKYGNDVVRYYLARDIVFGKDGDFSEENLVHRLNSDLANDYGNLLHRTIAMVVKNFDSIIPEPNNIQEIDEKLIKEYFEVKEKYLEYMESYKLTNALETIWEYIRYINKYFDENKPWVLAKEGNKGRLSTVLYNTLEAFLKVATLLIPFMPYSSEEVFNRLGQERNFQKILNEWNTIKPTTKAVHGKPLFNKIDLKKFEKIAVKKEEKKEEHGVLISIDDFKKLDLRTAKIIEAQKIEKSEKLLKLIVDLGKLGKRQIVAGIAKFYSPEELIGKKIVVVYNLKPAKLMGIESQGMLLAAKINDKLSILTVDKDIEPGAKIS
ncbi:methionyl-tRNA synthetase [Thermosipho melanesiensis]|uniref:Methionine--tRNA ligase n=2 Tax=Thermosipho melanesiensis TaxID=46541 RepID=A6LM90_THEM4|nr:methionine--tRNA ligase [Thermosipho melanesiensis]ABR31041.1 methionyl-tRNA synthetase [Thermosipho melanesiensis BI429]APT74135.1 methionyl-tRNA synthetase [Thermosipho melanesiensis]OOC36083.1 methionyl-tRNA synthetase [Thermosipho melanesiensis]OOC36900.1 methionyl-tRNA synthetase [Thermosipho melanesiensis]OOC37651.1 methionyl-tRNA synthetase [Thermosipho melanesiensis]